MLHDVGALRPEAAADDGTLAGDDMSRTHVVDVCFEVKPQQDGVAQGARHGAVGTDAALVFLEKDNLAVDMACSEKICGTSRSRFISET